MADLQPQIQVAIPGSVHAFPQSPSLGASAVEGNQLVKAISSSDAGSSIQNGGKKSPVQLVRNPSSRATNLPKSSSPTSDRPTTAIDPLSHHILKRTNTENTIPQKLRNAGTIENPVIPDLGLGSTESGNSGKHVVSDGLLMRNDSLTAKDKKKGVSFLSRFSIIGSKKRDLSDDGEDDESELGDTRTEGINAPVFSSSAGANGYIPKHKEPPRYIKVRAHHKKDREFNRMFLAQVLSGSKRKSSEEKVAIVTTAETLSRPSSKAGKSSGAVWAAEFSKDGKYLAAAGADELVRVWAVISTAEERRQHEYEEDITEGNSERLSAPVFRSTPVREFEGHTSVVLDLSWSKNNFLLSSSMDKTVRLWHISRQECLCTFKHKDFVTSIAFHPRDDRFFLAGSLDSILRLWSIPDKSVAFWNQLPDLITAVAFTPDGKTAIAGVLSGMCMFYETEGLKYQTQIHVRSSRGKNAKGSKITGIRTAASPDDHGGDIKVLISSNDSRVRLYNLRDKSLEMKFRGHENICSQIKASFSDDGRYVFCGSEDRKAYMWSTSVLEFENKDKRPVEYFEAHSDMVTVAINAPTKTRQLLGGSGDPIYDLCNPPPVTLLSRAESTVSSRPPTIGDQEKRNSDPISEPNGKKAEELSPAYLARSRHDDGNIIVTADHSGSIKVFRQDCASQKRRNETWETGSTFSKKIGSGMLGRTGSIVTRASGGGGSHSRRSSISRQRPSTSSQLPSDRILSWRNSVTTNGSNDGISSIRTAPVGHSDRSISPGKRGSTVSLPKSPSVMTPTKPRPIPADTPRQHQYARSSSPDSQGNIAAANKLPTPSFSLQSAGDDNPLRLDSQGKSYQFWNVQNWRTPFVAPDPAKLGSDLNRKQSVVSKLSSDDESGSPMEGDGESDGEALVCKRCGGKDFRAKMSRVAGGQRLVCKKCGLQVD